MRPRCSRCVARARTAAGIGSVVHELPPSSLRIRSEPAASRASPSKASATTAGFTSSAPRIIFGNANTLTAVPDDKRNMRRVSGGCDWLGTVTPYQTLGPPPRPEGTPNVGRTAHRGTCAAEALDDVPAALVRPGGSSAAGT